jgi:hypothetical protein
MGATEAERLAAESQGQHEVTGAAVVNGAVFLDRHHRARDNRRGLDAFDPEFHDRTVGLATEQHHDLQIQR